jgi:hypothetical protein
MTATRRDFAQTAVLAPLVLASVAFAGSSGSGRAKPAAGAPAEAARGAARAEEFDYVIAGAGHNSLICAAYLAKAGNRVLVLEGRPMIGGGVKTATHCCVTTSSNCVTTGTRPSIRKSWCISRSSTALP